MNNMMNVITSVRFEKYKSFSGNNTPFVIPFQQNLLLIIGRNNSGKSSLIDVIEEALNKAKNAASDDGIEDLSFSFLLDKKHIESVFSDSIYSVGGGKSDREYGLQYVGHELLTTGRKDSLAANKRQFDPELEKIGATDHLRNYWNSAALMYGNDIHFCTLRRVNAERDIKAEFETDNEEVSFNGDGATNLVRKFINTSAYDESIVEKEILSELNRIMTPEASFSAIRVQEVGNREDNGYKWEIFLEEDGHRYAMSKCGSGLKTVLLILINLYLVPKTKVYKDAELCFAFEEIENNLHPALQRRVFEYLYDYSVQKDCKVFITTHSHIAINTFYGKEKALLFHVIKENGVSGIESIKGGNEREKILNDLDVRASDLFQSNGIIWVEGPSDRVYILKWLEVFCHNSFLEGQHFQFMYYGGRLLAHYVAEDFEHESDGLINILATNRHAVLVMDSDKKHQSTPLNETKKRVISELEIKGIFCWRTKGKEIENYIAVDAINKAFSTELPQVERYECFDDYIANVDHNFPYHKVETAKRICQFITAENSGSILDLKESICRIYEEICKWNNCLLEKAEKIRG